MLRRRSLPHGVGALALALMLLAPASLSAQSAFSTIRGTVVDQTGSILPGADVTVTDLNTNVGVRAVVSDANGNYEIPDLKPGLYSLETRLTGFRTFVADSILLEATTGMR